MNHSSRQTSTNCEPDGARELAPPVLDRVLLQARRIAVLVPCFNEEASVGAVVDGFKTALANADIYVYDNNSTDLTAHVAAAAGAVVRREPLQGKGNVVRRMFADVDADVYVMVDGDATYDASHAPGMIDLLVREQLDMVVGVRVSSEDAAYRRGHRLGNRMLTLAVAHLFESRFTDMLSGYRVLSRRFVKSFPAMTSGFETETELTIHALELRLPVAEVSAPYSVRAEGSASKLQTYSDGLRILRQILVLYKNERPLKFFSAIGFVLGGVALALGIPLFVTFIETGLVFRQPTAILATGLILLSALSFVTGLILDTVTRGRREMKRLAYLSAERTVRR
jgi:glycosyltransferase involved in cell wall biosynthesis